MWRALLLILAAPWAVGACYAPSAMQQSAQRIEQAWDVEQQGPAVVLAGPGLTTWALGELAVDSLRRPPEPRHQWFRAYPGQMRPLSEVALLCHASGATNATALQSLDTGQVMPARYARWHYPECLEVLQGRYRLQVHYYSRQAGEAEGELSTETSESSRASVVEWDAVAGGFYRLSAELGPAEPAEESEVSFFRAPPRPGTPGTTVHEIEARSFQARIERVATPEELDPRVLEYREAWRHWEEAVR